MEIMESITEGLLGILLIFIGHQVGWKGRIELIHWYHYAGLRPEDKSTYLKKMGASSVVIGGGFLSMPVLNWISHSDCGYYVGLAAVAVGIARILYVIIKYNGGLFRGGSR